jgi:hypothetical protein
MILTMMVDCLEVEEVPPSRAHLHQRPVAASSATMMTAVAVCSADVLETVETEAGWRSVYQ